MVSWNSRKALWCLHFRSKGGSGWSFFLDFYIGGIQNCHPKRKVVIEMNILYRDFAKRVPPPSTHSKKSRRGAHLWMEKGRRKGDNRMLEKQIERKLVTAVQRHGGMCPKWVSPGLDGVPDRIICHVRPYGMIHSTKKN